VVWRGGEARRQKGRLGGRAVAPHFLGVVQKNDNEDECLDIEKMEGSGGGRRDWHIEAEIWAIERIERTGKHLRSDERGGKKMESMQ
jgi:hypothetical protein